MRLALSTFALAVSATALAGCGMFAPVRTPEARVTLRVADAAMMAGDPDMALRVAEIVLRREPTNVAAMVARADALYALGTPDDARAAYRQAVTADPSNAAAELGLGRTLVRTDPHAAETAFRAALIRQPDNVLALNDLGIACDMQGHHAAAQTAYRHALAVAPGSPDVQTNLGLSLALSGDGTQAVGMLRPLAAALEATSLQRADLAVAVVGTHPAPDSPAAEEIPLAITRAPAVPVRREALPLPVVAVAPKGRAVRPPPVDPALVTADASAIEQPDPPRQAVVLAPLATVGGPDPAQPAIGSVHQPHVAVVAPARPPVRNATSIVGYYVQMAALDSAEAASVQWQMMRARWPALLADRTPVVQQAEVNRRTFWRLRTGLFASAGGANGFCAKLRALGAGCWTIAARD